ncbi:MAG: GNAT family N-acetyltransferase [FCB group bacterium]|nr:GNAT family N-acetyltransferase [FCB group bacterium]
MQSLITSRLLLRPLGLTDAKAIDTNIRSEAVLEHMRNLSYPYDTDRTIPFIREAIEDFISGKQYVYAICNKKKNNLMGIIALSHIDRRSGSAEIYYWLGESYWHRGYMLEAVSAVLEHGFYDLALKRIFARVCAGNTASVKLLEKAGFRLEHMQKNGRSKDGKYEDELYYAREIPSDVINDS